MPFCSWPLWKSLSLRGFPKVRFCWFWTSIITFDKYSIWLINSLHFCIQALGLRWVVGTQRQSQSSSCEISWGTDWKRGRGAASVVYKDGKNMPIPHSWSHSQLCQRNQEFDCKLNVSLAWRLSESINCIFWNGNNRCWRPTRQQYMPVFTV